MDSSPRHVCELPGGKDKGIPFIRQLAIQQNGHLFQPSSGGEGLKASQEVT